MWWDSWSFQALLSILNSFNRKVAIERCKEAPKVFKLRSRDDLNVQVLVKSFLEKFQTSLPDALLIPFDINEPDPLVKSIKIINETDLNSKNINFWIVDGQHTIQATKEILTNPKYNISTKVKKNIKNVMLDSCIHQWTHWGDLHLLSIKFFK